MATINGKTYYTKGYVKRVKTESDKFWLSVIEDIKAEIKALDIEDVCAKEHGCHTEVLELIDRKVNKVK